MPVASRVSLNPRTKRRRRPSSCSSRSRATSSSRLALLALGKDLPPSPTRSVSPVGVGGAGARPRVAESQRFNMNAGDLLGDAFGGRVRVRRRSGSDDPVNRPKYQDTTYTAASRTVAANSAISTVPISPGSEQVDLTIFRYAGPYDQANIRVAPYGIDAMDARMGVHKLSRSSVVTSAATGTSSSTRSGSPTASRRWARAPAASTRRGTPRTTTSPRPAPLDGLQHDRACRALARQANIPLRGDRKRILVITPQQGQNSRTTRSTRDTPVPPDVQPALPGTSRASKFDIFKSNTLNKGREQLERQRQPRPRVRSGPLRHRHGRRARVAPSTDDNYGETAKVIWIAYLAMQMFDNHFGVSVHTG